MSDRQQMYSQLEEARKVLLDAFDGLTPDQMTVPMLEDWSVKDILTHVASWDEFALPDLRRVGRGHMPALLSFREAEVNDWNRMIMSLRRNFPLDQVMSEIEECRKATMAALLSTAASGSGIDGWVPAMKRPQTMGAKPAA